MKAIILAAGMGTRLGAYTAGRPKGMLEFAGKSLIERQVDTLRASGITDITIVKGYMPQAINIPGTKSYVNERYADTNMVETLFCAEAEMTEDFLVCYSDILYEPHVLNAVLSATCAVGVTVDTDFQEYWAQRLAEPASDNESFQIGPQGNVTELGSPNPVAEHMDGRYVGLIKFAGAGVADLRRVYHEQERLYGGSSQPWLHSKCFRKGYMTDMLQSLINAGVRVDPIRIRRGWLEFDTVEDYEKYQQWVRDGTMSRFFSFR